MSEKSFVTRIQKAWYDAGTQSEIEFARHFGDSVTLIGEEADAKLEAWAYERATLYSLIDMAGAELENLIKFTDPMIRNRIIKLVGLLKEQSEMEFEEVG